MADPSEKKEDTSEPAPADWQAYAQRHYKWNHFWGLLSSTAIMNPIATVTSAFIRDIKNISGSAFLDANINSIVSILLAVTLVVQYLPQLFVANFLETRERKIPAFVFLAVAVCLFLAAWPVMAYFFVYAAPIPCLVIFCLTYFGSRLTLGCNAVVVNDIFGKAIPLEKRNGFFGNRYAVTCVMAFVASTLMTRILDPHRYTDKFRQGYTWLYAFELIVVILNCFAFYLIREPIHRVRKEKKAVWPFLVESFRTTILKDKNYRAFAAMRVLQMLGGLSTGLGVLFMTEELGLPLSAQGTALQWSTAANLIASYLFGRVGNALGSKFVLQMSSVFAALAAFGLVAIPLLARELQSVLTGWAPATIVLGLYVFTTVLSQLGVSCNAIGRTTYPIDIAPATLRPTYIGFAMTMLVPFILMQSLGGVIADHSSRQVVFVICGVIFSLSLIPSFWMQNVSRAKETRGVIIGVAKGREEQDKPINGYVTPPPKPPPRKRRGGG